MITRIRIPSKWYQPASRKDYGGERFETAIFNLGVGPCGKEVIELDIDFQHAVSGVLVTQVCSDTEAKSFFYPYHTVTGRIEITKNNS